MKKKILPIIVCTLLLCLFLAGGALADYAEPTDSVVMINGEQVDFNAYLISDSNYIKLRDLAYIMSATNARFDVGWDGVHVSLTSGRNYTEVGGECVSKGDGAKYAVQLNMLVIKDGLKIPMSAYEIDGNNYFKLRDIAEVIDFSVEWDSGTVLVDTGKPYVMPEVTALSVNNYPLLLIGKTKGEIDAKLGTPKVNYSTVVYPNGLVLGFGADYPSASMRCTFVGGRNDRLINGLRAPLSFSDAQELFVITGISYDEMDNIYNLLVWYDNIPLLIGCDKDGVVKPDSRFYFNVRNGQ